MRHLLRLSAVIAALATALLGAPAVLANAGEGEGGHHAVFVQTNNPAGNSIAAYSRNGNGTLTYVATYSTGGKGGRAAGAAVDPLASQSSLVYDSGHHLLLAPNAGSDTVSVFRVRGNRLRLEQIVASGGPFPASIAVHDDIAYVLDAGLAGYVQGYRIAGGRLHPIAGSLRSLGLANSNPPAFLKSPAQVGFTPDGRDLVITLKTSNGGSVDVFGVSHDGQLTSAPTATSLGGVPFAFVFDPEGRLVIVNAAFGNLSTYTVNRNGSLSLVSAGASDGQIAACWVTAVNGNFYAANTGSGSLSQFTIDEDGTVALKKSQAATGIPGATDMAASGHFLYAQSGGSGSVKAFAVSADGSLTLIGSWPVPDGSSQEGIAAS
ncbi:MAG: lactonase family protein [Candidatus Dormibacteraeota bacterium]|nr:lactonase family protein [Candidatus Dormibacteraeota bacterium]